MLIDALSRAPEGIQITVYPKRATVDLGYCGYERFEAESLDGALYKAYCWLYSHPTCPPEVRVALEAINSRGSTSTCFKDLRRVN